MIRAQTNSCRNISHIAAMMAASVLLVAASGCTSRPPAPSLDEHVQMSPEGVADDQIFSRSKESRAIHRFSTSGIVDLEQRGVSMAVLDYTQATSKICTTSGTNDVR
jgi:hypothetical protein